MLSMTYTQLETHFGDMRKVMAALNVGSRQTIYNWKNNGIPEGVQYRIQVLTGGALKAEDRAAA